MRNMDGWLTDTRFQKLPAQIPHSQDSFRTTH
jgi:hypothetical protein